MCLFLAMFCSLFFTVLVFIFSSQEFACNGTVIDHPEYGEVIQLQGDQRKNIAEFLCRIELAKKDQIKIHGF